MAKRKRQYGSTDKQHRGQAASWARTFRAALARANEAIRYHSTDSCSTAFTHVVNAAQSAGYYDAHQGSSQAGAWSGGRLRRRGEAAAARKLRGVIAAYRRKCIPSPK